MAGWVRVVPASRAHGRHTRVRNAWERFSTATLVAETIGYKLSQMHGCQGRICTGLR